MGAGGCALAEQYYLSPRSPWGGSISMHRHRVCSPLGLPGVHGGVNFSAQASGLLASGPPGCSRGPLGGCQFLCTGIGFARLWASQRAPGALPSALGVHGGIPGGPWESFLGSPGALWGSFSTLGGDCRTPGFEKNQRIRC